MLPPLPTPFVRRPGLLPGVTTVGKPDCAKAKRHEVLSSCSGVTDMNHGLMSMAEPVLRVHNELVDKLQIRIQPTSHLACRWIQLYKVELGVLCNPATYDPVYEAWRAAMQVNVPPYPKQGLVDKVDQLLVVFVGALKSGVESRLLPYWSLLKALEMADPRTPIDRYTNDDWTACEDLCTESGLQIQEVRRELTLVHQQYAQVWCLDARHQKMMSVNMLRWYHAEQTGVLQRFPNARKCAAVVFRKPIVSVVIECFFSGMKYNQSTTQ